MLAGPCAVGKQKTRLYVFRFQEWVLPENGLCGVACRKHPQNVLHCHAHVADGISMDQTLVYLVEHRNHPQLLMG